MWKIVLCIIFTLSVVCTDNINPNEVCTQEIMYDGWGDVCSLTMSYTDPAFPKDDSVEKTAVVLRMVNDNQLNSIPKNIFTYYTRLNTLTAQETGIQTLKKSDFQDATYLEQLDLSRNNIEILTENVFEFVINLKHLILSNNKISDIDRKAFNALSGLLQLDLSENKIEVITPNLFDNLSNLVRINLGHNKIQIIRDNMFANNVNLKYIDLENNRIEFVGPESFTGPRFHLLELLLMNCTLDTLHTGSISSLRFTGSDRQGIKNLFVHGTIHNLEGSSLEYLHIDDGNRLGKIILDNLSNLIISFE